MPGLVTATGVLAFLADEEPELKVFALQTLNDDINTVWTEVAGALSQIEALYEDESFPERQLAALVLAKVYYHLQAYNDSMVFALAAGDLFKLDSPGEFEETIISKCVDQYIAMNAAKRSKPKALKASDLPELTTTFSHTVEGAVISPTAPFSHVTLPPKSLLSRASVDDTLLDASFHFVSHKQGKSGSAAQLPDRATEVSLQRVIERLFESCLSQGRYRQVVGIAIEARNLEVLRRVIQRASEDERCWKSKSPDLPQSPAEELMEYTLGICMDIVQERGFRTEILRLILDLLNDIPNPDFFAIARCVVYLNSDEVASRMLQTLVVNADRTSIANAYQIAFDLYDNGTQEFLGKVLASLPSGAATKKDETAEKAGDSEESQPLAKSQPDEEEEAMPEKVAKVYRNIRSILDGSQTIRLNTEFLYRNNRADMSILTKVRDSLEARNSIFHTALTFCNAFMNQGTTNDRFFRDNLDWLGKAVNWSKFTTTASLGVIHRGNLTQSQRLLEPYLPRYASVGNGSPFSQGGALYAYGLIHANHGSDALDYFKMHFGQAEEEVIQHGGALGLGIAGMATGDAEAFEKLKEVLFQDSAINGEAVGLAMGLIMLGTGNVKALEDMITYAHETTHEKIVRGVAIGMALIMYGRQEGADALIEGLLSDPDPTLRYGGIMTVAMAYCGTGSNKAIRKLLHTAVSDVNDDVRRIAVMSLGFILFRKPGSVPRMVELLSESYNPHVRYGSAMALGISCAGTGLDEAIDLLEPMMKDPTDFVRQGALISLAMIMVQQNEVMNPKVSSIRKTLRRVVGDRHEDAMTKFGAALALGIIDAGGRNCTIGLQTQTGNLNMTGIVGMAVFTQYWYWFPFTLFLSLSFSPTAVIGLDHDLEIPDFRFHCAARQSLFDYPPEQEVKAEEGPALIATAILSTTAQAKRRAQKKERAQRRESMDVDSTPAKGGDKMDVDDEKKKEDPKEKKETDEKEATTAVTTTPGDCKRKAEKEKIGYEIENMSRVLPGQLRYISFPAGRYKPVKKPTGGPLLLDDTQPGEPKSLIEEKLKMQTTERAPVAGQQSTRAGAGGRSGGPGRSLLERLMEQSRRSSGNPAFEMLRNQGRSLMDQDPTGLRAPASRALDGTMGSGAAAAAGVLTAVDEDGEGEDEARLPGEFEYFSDGGMDEGE